MSHESDQRSQVTALAALRDATSSLHAVLDSGLPLARDGAGLHEYVDHLQHLRPWLAAYLEAERALGDVVDADSVERKQVLIARIDGDLEQARSGSASACAGRASLSEETVRSMHDPAYRWGVDYVIEGSQLGGSVMYRKFSESLAPHPLAYLRGDAPDTSVHWRAFMTGLNAAVTTPQDIASACRGAVDAFNRLAASFGMGREGERQTMAGQAA